MEYTKDAIDFSEYSYDELVEALENLDSNTHPERAAALKTLISQKQVEAPVEVAKSEQISGEQAKRVHRLGAAVIDLIINLVASVPLFIMVGMEAFKEPSIELLAIALGYGLLSFALLHGYLLYTRGQTIGKYFLGIRISTLDGEQASFERIFLRRVFPVALVNQIPMVGGLLAGIVNPLFIFGKSQRCLHDYAAGTKVTNV